MRMKQNWAESLFCIYLTTFEELLIWYFFVSVLFSFPADSMKKSISIKIELTHGAHQWRFDSFQSVKSLKAFFSTAKYAKYVSLWARKNHVKIFSVGKLLIRSSQPKFHLVTAWCAEIQFNGEFKDSKSKSTCMMCFEIEIRSLKRQMTKPYQILITPADW